MSGQHWTFSEPDHTYCRSEQRRMQGLIATLSGGSLELASHQEDEEQEDEEDSLQQASSAPDMLPTQRARMISEFSQEDLSKVRAAAREDHVATLRD